MDKKDIFVIIIKVVIYALTLILSAMGLVSLTSCSASRDVDIRGRTTIVTTDTTFINHNTVFNYHKN